MQRNQNDSGRRDNQGGLLGDDVGAKQSRRKVLERDDHRVGIDYTGPGGVVSPHNTTPAGVDTAATALPPRLVWSTGPPIVRPATGPVLTRVKSERRRRPKNIPRNSWSEDAAALMRERSAVCM